MKTPSPKKDRLSKPSPAPSENPPPPASPGHEASTNAPSAKTRLRRKPATETAARITPEQPPSTTVEANVDVGFGNALFIRGQGDGLSWEKGEALTCRGECLWVWQSAKARGPVIFKLLLNDLTWAQGDDVRVEAGQSVRLAPVFEPV